MARFKEELPNDLIKMFQELDQDSEKMIGEMTKAGAEKVYFVTLAAGDQVAVKVWTATIGVQKGLFMTDDICYN